MAQVSELPPVDPLRNRAVLASRLGWPDEALALCIISECEFPEWDFFWGRGGLPADPDPGYRAKLRRHSHRVHLFGETIEVLRAKVAAVQQELPPRPDWARIPPLT